MKTTIVIAALLGLGAGAAFAQTKESTPMKDSMPAAKDSMPAAKESAAGSGTMMKDAMPVAKDGAMKDAMPAKTEMKDAMPADAMKK